MIFKECRLAIKEAVPKVGLKGSFFVPLTQEPNHLYLVGTDNNGVCIYDKYESEKRMVKVGTGEMVSEENCRNSRCNGTCPAAMLGIPLKK